VQLNKSRSGTLNLNGTNTFTGGVPVNSGGAMQIGGAGSLG